MTGSFIAGWMLPAVSIACAVTVCSPGVASAQSIDQIVHANSASSSPSSVAGCQGPSSIRTSTRSMGAPQASPVTLWRLPTSVTRAGRTSGTSAQPRFPPDGLTCSLLLADGDVVACHDDSGERLRLVAQIDGPVSHPLHVLAGPSAQSRRIAIASADQPTQTDPSPKLRAALLST